MHATETNVLARPATEPFRSRRWGRLAAALFGLCALAVVGMIWLANATTQTALRKGKFAPKFALKDQEGRTHQLTDYAGRPVLVVFYPGIDSTSEKGLLSLRDTVRGFDAMGVKLFAIGRGDTSTQRQFHAEKKIGFPLLSDPEGKIAKQYGVGPGGDRDGYAAFLIGPRGTVIQPILDVQPERQGEQLAYLTECCLHSTRQGHIRLMGKPVEDFRLPRVSDGKPEALYAKGKHPATVVYVVSSDCPCSKGYDERMRKVAEDYAPQGVRFIAINASANEKVPEIAEHARAARFPFPVLRDEGARIADRLGAQVTPEVFVMDQERVLRYHGRIDDSRIPEKVQKNDLRNALDALLVGKLPLEPESNTFGCAIARASKG